MRRLEIGGVLFEESIQELEEGDTIKTEGCLWENVEVLTKSLSGLSHGYLSTKITSARLGK